MHHQNNSYIITTVIAKGYKKLTPFWFLIMVLYILTVLSTYLSQELTSALSKLNFGINAPHPMSSYKEETGAVL